MLLFSSQLPLTPQELQSENGLTNLSRIGPKWPGLYSAAFISHWTWAAWEVCAYSKAVVANLLNLTDHQLPVDYQLVTTTLKEVREEGFLVTAFPAAEITSPFLKGDLGGTSQIPPQLME